MFALDARTIFVTLAGSQAHGTARAGSDIDVRGVCIAPLRVRLALFSRFEQYEGPIEGPLREAVLPRLRSHPTAGHGSSDKIECAVFDIAKFIGLCAAANPNTLEILFADPVDWLLDSPAWRRLYEQRHRFLTRRVQQTYLGYAMAQLKRIKTHRSWLLHPPARKPSRQDFGLPAAGTLNRDDRDRLEQSVADKVRSYGLETLDMPKATRIAVQERMVSFWMDVLSTSEEEIEGRLRAVATKTLGLPPEVVSTLNAERRYRAAMKHWESYQTWKSERNPARAELERRHGYDTKHAMHLIRLMRMGLEVLRTGDLIVRRPDADELTAIRDGALSFEDLLAAAAALREQMAHAAEQSHLPADVDRERVEELAFELMTAPTPAESPP